MRPSMLVLPAEACFLSAALAEGVAGLAAFAAPEPNRDEAALNGDPAKPLRLLVEAEGLKATEGSLMTDKGRPKAG